MSVCLFSIVAVSAYLVLVVNMGIFRLLDLMAVVLTAGVQITYNN